MSEKKTVLVVEDEQAMCKALSEKIAHAGYHVISAHDGEEGLEKSKEHPDLIMLDIIMPKIDGITLLKKIREEDSWGEKVPIIMLTNLSDPESVSEAAKYQVYDFLVKTDWRLDDVVGLVKSKIEKATE